MIKFDLLTTVEYGGCSAKLPAQKLEEILSKLPKSHHPKLLVGIDTHDDAGVYQISDDIALIQTTDFFPPICSDSYEFGQIAAANSLSDVYAMGGKPLTALNLMMFPDDKISLDVYSEILRGGNDKVLEAGAVVIGGHTINDFPPKYGLAVTGVVHPEKIITNSQATPGEVLILTKPLGNGIIVSGEKIGEVTQKDYQYSLNYMKLLNNTASQIMQKYNVCAATDITGFGFLGHALKIAIASKVSLKIYSEEIPLLPGAYELADLGCIPGAAFRNQEYIEPNCIFEKVDYNRKMIMFDAQTSGGILMSVKKENAEKILQDLKENNLPHSKMVGEVIEARNYKIKIY